MKNGFTLIELLVILAVVGSLVSLGVAAFRDYTVRAKVYKVADQLPYVKQRILDYYNKNGVLPLSETEIFGSDFLLFLQNAAGQPQYLPGVPGYTPDPNFQIYFARITRVNQGVNVGITPCPSPEGCINYTVRWQGAIVNTLNLSGAPYLHIDYGIWIDSNGLLRSDCHQGHVGQRAYMPPDCRDTAVLPY